MNYFDQDFFYQDPVFLSPDLIEDVNIDDYLLPQYAEPVEDEQVFFRMPEDDIFGNNGFTPLFEPASPSAYFGRLGQASSTDDSSDLLSFHSSESLRSTPKAKKTPCLKKKREALTLK